MTLVIHWCVLCKKITRYSIERWDCIFVKAYEFLPLVKKIGKNIGKSVRKNLSGKYSQKPFDHLKQSATDALKTIRGKRN